MDHGAVWSRDSGDLAHGNGEDVRFSLCHITSTSCSSWSPLRLLQSEKQQQSSSDNDKRRKLNVVVDLNMNEDMEAPDDWLRRHHVVVPKKKTKATSKDEQKLKPK